MKPFLALLGAVLLPIVPAKGGLVLQPDDVLAICGDSITEQKQYSVFMEDYLLMCQPVAGLRVVQFGWGGETAGGFQTRIESDVLPFKPTVVTTCYGMNDGGYAAMTQRTGDTYRQAMTGAAEKLKANGVRALVLGSPGCVDGAAFTNPRTSADVYNQTLDALRAAAQEVAHQEGTGFADVYAPMMDVMAKAKAAYGNSYALVAGGGIHPNNNGQLVMAFAFLKAMGCDGAIGTVTVDLGAGKATGTPGQQVVSCEKGLVTLKSTRYPFCFLGEPDKPEQMSASVLRFFPFNDDLNRYLLVVKGLEGSKAKVTWANQTREFAAADLAKGVNLAAEFLQNPFREQFFKVNAAVEKQQTLETTFVKQYMHNVPAFTAMAPAEAGSLQKVTAAGMEKDKQLFDTARDLVVPIQHTIQIEAEP